MKYSDEILMAYADGELDEATRADIEQAMRADQSIAARVEQHRSLRDNVFAAFAPVVDEPVPQRLRQAARPRTELPPEVTPIDLARAAREAKRQPPPQRRSWMQLGGIAAAALIGVMAGRESAPESDIASSNGVLVAQAGLADALSNKLASSGQDGTRIGVTFVTKDGAYCRSFTHQQTAGLACREGGRWTLPVVAEGGAAGGDYRQAGSEMPPAVLEAIDERIEGDPLNATQEQAAARKNWQH
jgi:hypothetical protein